MIREVGTQAVVAEEDALECVEVGQQAAALVTVIGLIDVKIGVVRCGHLSNQQLKPMLHRQVCTLTRFDDQLPQAAAILELL